ncbi:FHA domain-containing protein [Candidatus Rariloculus sp.]|uniref:FHA domain-containing protein n=1 Tax=Candidatus Rariloculus sp. TaxID=3101265 RepID=UPI003D0B4B66
MQTLAIEINDAGLVVADGTDVLAVEPGYALVENGAVTTGLPAYGQARVKPRQVSNSFWANLSLEEGSAGVEGVPHSAELAYEQLGALWRKFANTADEVLLIVPGHYRQAQLGLLLGLAEECRMPVRAMVEAAVAASHMPYPGRQLLYADAGLHRVSLTALVQGDDVSARPEQGLDATGLADLTDLLARRVAEIFVHVSRFDPFHDARSEQLLYDRLPEWLNLLHERSSAVLSLPHGGDELAVEVEREQLLNVALGFYKALLQLIAQAREAGSSLVVQLSDRLARLPGLTDELARLDDAEVVGLVPGHAANAALKSLRAIDKGEQVKLLRRMSWRAEPAPAPETAPAIADAPITRASTAAPTHVVYRGVAYSVEGTGLLIGRSDSDNRRVIVVDDQPGGVSRSHCELKVSDGELRLRDLSSYGTFVNERRVSGEETLQPADIIRIGSPGAEIQVVTVES